MLHNHLIRARHSTHTEAADKVGNILLHLSTPITLNREIYKFDSQFLPQIVSEPPELMDQLTAF